MRNVNEIVKAMKIGWNLGNSLDSFEVSDRLGGETGWGNPATEKRMIDEIASVGFNLIRIPVTWFPYVNDEDHDTICPAHLARVEEIASEVLPRGYDTEWSGVAKEEKESGGQTLVIFAICLAFVYLLLAAQYESLLLPLPVILSLPAGVFGSFFLLYVVGLENNIYAQVALVMLIGLLGKNAILIIEVANQCRKEGISVMGAAIQGATSRLRPILMTSFAFISGLIPLTIASGAGALGNRSIGTAAAGGMLIGTFVGIFLIPGLYVIFESLATYFKKRKEKEQIKEDEYVY